MNTTDVGRQDNCLVFGVGFGLIRVKSMCFMEKEFGKIKKIGLLCD